MAQLLAERVAVITGGASGNGRAIALAFAREGADVVVTDIREDPREGGDPTHEIINSTTESRATFVAADVTSRTDLEQAVDCAEDYGGIDIMVNNAGIYNAKPTLETSEADFDRMMAVNVKGVFFGAQVAAERMLEADQEGTILNISSVAGMEGTAETVLYCASKGAVRLMTYALADEFGPAGIRVNAIHPGVIETEMTTTDVPMVGSEMGDQFRESVPLGTFGQPDDVADAAVFLASERAGYINGESLIIDGGMHNTS